MKQILKNRADKLNTARELKKMGLSVVDIAKATGLSEKEIEKALR